jgi:hypothetical protein
MSSTLKTNAIEPEGATTEIVVGKSGQAITVGGSGGLKTNTLKDNGNGYKYASFTTTGNHTWTCPTAVTSAEILVVAGGGSGGTRHYGGGGGGGGVVHASSFPVTAGTVYDITVGAGGASQTSAAVGNSGANSVFNVNGEGSNTTVLTAVGGGGGGYSGAVGVAGGSGGGGGATPSVAGGATNQPTSLGSGIARGMGHAGGTSTASGNAAGGGGAGGPGAVAGTAGAGNESGGNGGPGALFPNFLDYGRAGYFAGGGGGSGGGHTVTVLGSGGVGGGGRGSCYTPQSADNEALPAIHGTGGGGGGAYGPTIPSGGNGVTSGAGGNGIVIVRYQDPTENTLFTSNGSGALSSVSSTFDEAQVLLATATASNSASLSFTTLIDNTYDEYVFEFINIHAITDQANFTFQTSTNGGSSYGVSMTSTFLMAYHQENDGDVGLQYQGGLDLHSSTSFQQIFYYMGNGADESGSGELHLFNPSNGNLVKHFYARGNVNISGARSDDDMPGGYFATTTPINAIQFKMSSGNIDSGTIKMYGIK